MMYAWSVGGTDTAAWNGERAAAGAAGTPAAELEPGTMIAGRYRVTEALGRGAFSRVYEAWDLSLHRRTAVKIYPEQAGQVCEDEARLQAACAHPCVMPLLDAGADPLLGVSFLVMPRYPGSTLARLLATRGPLPVGAAIRITEQVCSALSFLRFRRNALHGDVKPANTYVTPGGALLLDFNVHGLLVRGGPARVGTPGYTAPEALAGRPCEASDVFSTGCVLYEMLTGTPAFRDDAAVQAGLYVPLRQLRPDLAPGMDRIVRAALEPDLSRRFATARELEQALRAARWYGGYRLDTRRVWRDVAWLGRGFFRGTRRLTGWLCRQLWRRPVPTLAAGMLLWVCGSSALEWAGAWCRTHAWQVGAVSGAILLLGAATLAERWRRRPYRARRSRGPW